jgi:hypothetical protein
MNLPITHLGSCVPCKLIYQTTYRHPTNIIKVLFMSGGVLISDPIGFENNAFADPDRFAVALRRSSIFSWTQTLEWLCMVWKAC